MLMKTQSIGSPPFQRGYIGINRKGRKLSMKREDFSSLMSILMRIIMESEGKYCLALGMR